MFERNTASAGRKIKQILQDETAFLHTYHLTCDQIYKYYITMFSKKVTYPMSTTFFFKKFLQKFQRPYHRALLQGLGYNKNTSIQVCYGSKSLMGIGIKCLYLEQGCKGVMAFICHWRDNSIISKLLRITVSWIQHSLGTGISLFQDNRELPHLESKWICFIRQFLRHINATFDIDEEYIPALQREHDSHIMDHILNSNRFSKSEIKKLNYCRQWLQVHTISNLTLASGA